MLTALFEEARSRYARRRKVPNAPLKPLVHPAVQGRAVQREPRQTVLSMGSVRRLRSGQPLAIARSHQTSTTHQQIAVNEDGIAVLSRRGGYGHSATRD
jgi:hypothetical protein